MLRKSYILLILYKIVQKDVLKLEIKMNCMQLFRFKIQNIVTEGAEKMFFVVIINKTLRSLRFRWQYFLSILRF